MDCQLLLASRGAVINALLSTSAEPGQAFHCLPAVQAICFPKCCNLVSLGRTEGLESTSLLSGSLWPVKRECHLDCQSLL